MINYKFRAIKDRIFPHSGEPKYAKGKTYKVIDGYLTFENGWGCRVKPSFEEFIDVEIDDKEVLIEIKDIDTTKKYKGYEIIKMLQKHELQEGDIITFQDGIIKEEYSITQCFDTLSLREGNGVEVGNSILTYPGGEFSITLHIDVDKVDFITAWKAYLEGKKIKSFNGWTYQNGKMKDIDGVYIIGFSITREEIEGMWIIIE